MEKLSVSLKTFTFILVFGATVYGFNYSEGVRENEISKDKTPFEGSFEETLLEYHRVRYQPRHVHLSYTNIPTSMMVTWSTIDNPNSTAVEFGIRSCEEVRVNGTVSQFRDPGGIHLVQYIHRVTLRDLVPGQIYWYHCGGDEGWSAEFYFTAMQNGSDWSPRLAVYGDLGNENAQSLPRLQEEVQRGYYDAIVHVGDFAYNLESDNGLVGDSFLDQIEVIAAYVPYMTCPGNHEERYNFSHYKNRFSMPGPYESLTYSWDIGPIHFISLNTECYYWLKYGLSPVVNQYEWLKKDLQEATKPENRRERPWIIVYGHRPMYCSNTGERDCNRWDDVTRVGIPLLHIYGLEELFMENGVDLAIWAHQHSYERMFPLYNYTVYNGSITDPYWNPKALVHITTGSAGCWEEHAHFKGDRPPWSAFRNTDYGYSRLQALNKTHLFFEQVSDDQNGLVVDSFTLVREVHAAYTVQKRQ